MMIGYFVFMIGIIRGIQDTIFLKFGKFEKLTPKDQLKSEIGMTAILTILLFSDAFLLYVGSMLISGKHFWF